MELLVVITIIAVLAAVSIPQIIGVIQRAQNAAITADIRAIHMHAIKVHTTGIPGTPPIPAAGNFDTVRCPTAIPATPINADISAMCASIEAANGTPAVVSHTAASPAQEFCISSLLHTVGGVAQGSRCADRFGHWHRTAAEGVHCGTDIDLVTAGVQPATRCRP